MRRWICRWRLGRPGWLVAGAAALALGAASMGLLPGVARAATWKLEPVPLPSGSPFGGLYGASCTATGACTAVGVYASSTRASYDQLPLAERWDGADWSPQSTPGFSHGRENGLNGVTCVSASWCMAVGGYQPVGSGYFSTLAEVWAGSAWAIVPSPSPPQEALLLAVSCVSARACMAVGWDWPTTQPVALAEWWDGSTWSLVPVPLPAGASSSVLFGVSCTSATSCTAAGDAGAGNGSLVERWNGSSWSIELAPTPPGYSSDYFRAVSCPSATACTATGQAGGASGQAFAERWSGSSWSAQSGPSLGVSQSLFNGVSCAGLSWCDAVGFQVDGSGTQLPLAEGWNGVSWSVQSTPVPANADGVLEGVSCLAVSWCMAAGFSQSSAPPYDTLPYAWLYAASMTPSLSTSASAGVVLGGQVHDTATISGGQSPTSYLHFKLYGPDDQTCSRAPVYASAVKISGDGSYSSGSFTPTSAGSYRYTVTYSGDNNNNPAYSLCNATGERVNVFKASPSL